MERKVYLKVPVAVTVYTDLEDINDIIDDLDVEITGTECIVDNVEIIADEVELTDAK